MTTWTPEDLLPIGEEHSYTRNLFPESNVFSRALAQIIVEYEWKSFTILYDHPDGNPVHNASPLQKKSIFEDMCFYSVQL